MQAAIKAVKMDKMPLSTAAKTFKMPRNTLRRRIVSKEHIPKFEQHTMSYARARGMNREKVAGFYELLSKLMEDHNLYDNPAKIFNCDETGLQLIYKPKKLFPREESETLLVRLMPKREKPLVLWSVHQPVDNIFHRL